MDFGGFGDTIHHLTVSPLRVRRQPPLREGQSGVAVRLAASDRTLVDHAIRVAETATRIEISVYLGAAAADTRDFAERLHALLAAPDRSLLILIDTSCRSVEIVTGRVARERIADETASKAAASMLGLLGADRVVEAVVAGLRAIESQGRSALVRG
ncbi:MAG: DUF5130 family protein [Marmoricola sp.]